MLGNDFCGLNTTLKYQHTIMSLANLTVAELQNLLMEETKKLTTALREGFMATEKDEIRNNIEEIIKALKEKNPKNGPINPLGNY